MLENINSIRYSFFSTLVLYDYNLAVPAFPFRYFKTDGHNEYVTTSFTYLQTFDAGRIFIRTFQ